MVYSSYIEKQIVRDFEKFFQINNYKKTEVINIFKLINTAKSRITIWEHCFTCFVIKPGNRLKFVNVDREC